MKKLACLLLVGVVYSSCHKLRDYFPHPEVPQFNKTYGGTTGDGARSLTLTGDGGYIFTGTSESNDGDVSGNHGITDAWVVKLDKSGNKDWQKMLGGSSVDHGNAIARTPDGGYILAASTTSNDGDVSGYHGGAGEDIWLVKLDKSGGVQWQKTLGGSASDVASSVLLTSDGNYVLAGYTESNDGDLDDKQRTQYDAWIVKLNAQGGILWQKTFGGSGLDYAYSIIPTLDGGYIMAGNTQSNDAGIPGYHARGDAWVVKLYSDGSLDWQKALGGWNYDVAFSITAAADSAYVLAGSTTSPNGDVKGHHGNADAWIVKIDKKGKIVWAKALGGSLYDHALSITATPDGEYAFAGYTSSNDGDVSWAHGNGHDDAWVAKLNAGGTLLWQKATGGTLFDQAADLIAKQNGDLVMAGTTLSNDGDVAGNHGQTDAWVFTLKDK